MENPNKKLKIEIKPEPIKKTETRKKETRQKTETRKKETRKKINKKPIQTPQPSLYEQKQRQLQEFLREQALRLRLQGQQQPVQGFPDTRSTLISPPSSPSNAWTIDRIRRPILNLNDPPNWTVTTIDTNEPPIWGQIQGSSETNQRYHTDKQTRYIVNMRQPPQHFLDLYHFIIDINNKFILSTSKCILPFPKITTVLSAKRKAFNTCCGFTAPIISAVLFIVELHKYSKQSHDHISIQQFEQLLLTGFDINYKGEDMTVNAANINEKLFRCYMFISGYANISKLGWNTNCPRIQVLHQGINLVNIVGPINATGWCTTYHHFMVFVQGNIATISDTWAGGIHGCRGPWVRIMNKNDLDEILNDISNHSRDYDLLTEILQTYFNSPNIQGNYKVNSFMQIGIINGTDLFDKLWTYLYGIQDGNPSHLADAPTIAHLSAIEPPILISIEPNSPASSMEDNDRILGFSDLQAAQLLQSLRTFDEPFSEGTALGIKIFKQTRRRKPRRRKYKQKK